MSTAILYLRVETEAERSNLFEQSIDAVSFLEPMSLIAVFVIQEVSNLPPLKRPAFSTLIEEITTGKKAPNYLVVPKWTTLSNNAKEALGIMDWLAKTGIKFITIEALKEGKKANHKQP